MIEIIIGIVVCLCLVSLLSSLICGYYYFFMLEPSDNINPNFIIDDEIIESVPTETMSVSTENTQGSPSTIMQVTTENTQGAPSTTIQEQMETIQNQPIYRPEVVSVGPVPTIPSSPTFTTTIGEYIKARTKFLGDPKNKSVYICYENLDKKFTFNNNPYKFIQLASFNLGPAIRSVTLVTDIGVVRKSIDFTSDSIVVLNAYGDKSFYFSGDPPPPESTICSKLYVTVDGVKNDINFV